MTNANVQIHDDYCKDASEEEISVILDRLSAILSASYSRLADKDAGQKSA